MLVVFLAGKVGYDPIFPQEPQRHVEWQKVNATDMSDVIRGQQRQRMERAERLQALRGRVQRSLDDPRPSLTSDEAEQQMARFMKETRES